MKEWFELGASVVEMAIHDYKKALKKGDQCAIIDCETFFNNEKLMSIYCDYNGVEIMNLVKARV